MTDPDDPICSGSRDNKDVERFLSPSEAAETLQLSLRHIRREIVSGKLPIHQFGRAQRISPEDFAAYCKCHRRQPRKPGK